MILIFKWCGVFVEVTHLYKTRTAVNDYHPLANCAYTNVNEKKLRRIPCVRSS